MRFLVDESTGFLVAQYMIEEGYDALAVATVLPQASDKEILAFAVRDERIVITNDKDFGDLVYFARLEHRGVILLRSVDHHPAARWRMLERTIQRYGIRLAGAFTVITDDGIRIRS